MSGKVLRYVYFVLYSFSDGAESGRCEIGYPKKITSIEDVSAIEKIIEEKGGHKAPFVENFIFLRTERKEDAIEVLG